MSDMTISQALRSAARIKGKLAEYRTRAAASVTYRSHAKPAFSFSDTMSRIESSRNELLSLESRLAVTNALTTIDFSGKSITLARAVKTLQELKGELAWLRGLPTKPAAETLEAENVYLDGGHTTQTYSVTCEMPESVRADRVDEVQASFDALNDLVEKKNHETPLLTA